MNKTLFTCNNCGEAFEENILPMKHAVNGRAYRLNREANCCVKPEYRDSEGFVKPERNLWSFLSQMKP